MTDPAYYDWSNQDVWAPGAWAEGAWLAGAFAPGAWHLKQTNDAWILASGVWDDSSPWNDASNWMDA